MTPENGHLDSFAPLARRLAAIALLAFLYFAAGRLGLLLAIPPGYATAIFPPAGFALAALLLYGNRVWLGVLLGSFALNLSMAPQFDSVFSTTGLVALCIGIGATLQGLLGAALIRRFVGFPCDLANERDIFRLFMLGGPVSCLLNSVVGTTTLFVAGAITADAFLFNWWTWWVGDVIGVFIATPLAFIALARPRLLWQQRVASVALPLLLTLTVVIILFVHASKWETQQQHADFSNYTRKAVDTLQADLRVYSAITESIEHYFVASGDVSRAQFKTFVSEVINEDSGIKALEWLPVIKATDRVRYEQGVRAEGYADFRITERNPGGMLIAAQPADEYIPVGFVEPYNGNENALGFNLASSPAILKALLEARDAGQAVATGRVKLVQETGDRFGFLLLIPVYDRIDELGSAEQRNHRIRGYVAAVLRVGDILGAVARDLHSQDIALRVIDEAAPVTEQVLYQSNSWSSGLAGSDLAEKRIITIGGRNWRIEFLPLPHYLVTHRAWQAWATLAGGLLFTGMLGALLLLITGHTSKARQVVDERTNDLRIILDNVVDGIFTIDAYGIVQSFNRAAETIFGYQASEVIGQNVVMLMPEPYHNEHDAYLQNSGKSGIAGIIGIGREVVGRRKDGSTFPMDLAVSSSIHNSQPLFIGLVRDITERKRVEQMKREFVSTVSHELRTPLTSINGALGLLAGGALGEMPDQAKQMIAMAHKNSLRLSSLINDLLDMDKLVAGKMTLDLQDQPLMPLLEQALESIRAYGEQYNVEFQLIVREDVTVRVDSGRIIQVLNNFLSNAAKFSPQGGRVEIAVRRIDNIVRVEVIDHGAGVPAEFRERVFQKFSQADSSDTRQKGGTGLGLAISKELIERMGGVIGFESVAGQGTCFYFELPL
ncbi:CHASE domain-containing protein [Sulfuriferula thiophila]|uniref:CHASE domain-containing protein n=1 Tax=Sulfuriferula thiophila TaxID=1781211 RepID=UPI000F60D602|nr:CHASE domain-containing protein [Sulfuriferula thiophila]